MTQDNESSLFLRVSLMGGVAVSRLGLEGCGWPYRDPELFPGQQPGLGTSLLSPMEPRWEWRGALQPPACPWKCHLPMSLFLPLIPGQQARVQQLPGRADFSPGGRVGSDATFLKVWGHQGCPALSRPQEVTYVSQSPQSRARSKPQTLYPTYPTCCPSAFWVGTL